MLTRTFPYLSSDDLGDLRDFFFDSLLHPPPSTQPPPMHPSEGIQPSRKQYWIMTGARLLQSLARRRKRPSIPVPLPPPTHPLEDTCKRDMTGARLPTIYKDPLGPPEQPPEPENVDKDKFPDLLSDELDDLQDFFIHSLLHPPPLTLPPPTHPLEGMQPSCKQYRIMTGARQLESLARQRKRPCIPNLKPNVGQVVRAVAELSPDQDNVNVDKFPDVLPGDLQDLSFDDLQDLYQVMLPHPSPLPLL